MDQKKSVYLDYAATTPMSETVVGVMQNYFSENFANPSSTHVMGQKTQGVLDRSRHTVANIMGCDWKEIIFTSSATESINLAIRGIVSEHKREGNKPHIVTTTIEHSAVLKTCRALEEAGQADVTYVPVNTDGIVDPEKIIEALRADTVLVSCMYVNNEIGTIQPVSDIAEEIHRASSFTKGEKPYFHVDAVQAANYLDIGVDSIGADMVTLSGHKIYGPKGVGVLYKKEGVNLKSLITGGGQERGFRAGTENVAAIAAFAAALQEAEELKKDEVERIKELREYFLDKVLEDKNIELNGSREKRSPNNINICIKNKDSETIIPVLDEKGVYVSAGSACQSRVPEPSHVISALGKADCAKSSVRISFGRGTNKEDVDYAINSILEISKKS